MPVTKDEVFGFREKDVAEALAASVSPAGRSGLQAGIQSLIQAGSHGVEGSLSPPPMPLATRIFIGSPKTAITAATGGDAGVDFLVGTGTSYIAQLDVDTLKLQWMYYPDGTTRLEHTVYNLSRQSIAVDTGFVYMLSQDVLGNFWVQNLGGILRNHCRFTLDNALTTAEATNAATIATQYGPGVNHPSTAITVRNLLTSTGGVYVFEGISGQAGLAIYDSGTTWNIIMMPCP